MIIAVDEKGADRIRLLPWERGAARGVADAAAALGQSAASGRSGHDHIRLLVADDGTPSIQLINAAGELVWSAP